MRKVVIRGLLAHKLRSALTALAIVLGVTFITGTFVLTETLHNTFTTLFGHVYQNVSFEIRGKAELTNQAAGSAERKPVPQSLVAAVRRLPGVAYVEGSVGGYAQFVAPDGKAISTGGAPTLGYSFDPNTQLSSLHLAEGAPPTTPHDVVMDEGTAKKYHFAVGERVRVLLAGPPQTFTLTGIVTFGTADNLAGATLAAFYLPTAQVLFDEPGRYDDINVLAKPGTNNAVLQRLIAKVLPPGVEVVTGQTVANEQTSAINNDLSFFSTALLVFAFISLFVGAFTIFNTFSITVGQRTRELALLRIVGASRRQLSRSVLAEAILVGLGASLIGLGLGVLAALGLEALLKAFGITLPSGALVFEARTVVVALVVGVGVTVVSAISPARRAVRIPPVAALIDHQTDTGESLRRRVTAGSIIAVVGVAVLFVGLTAPAIALVGLGALAVFIGAGMLAPVVARPMSSALGRPLARLLGISGKLGRENSMRSPRRTAQTSSALMVGLALVATIAVFGASLSRSSTSSIDNAISADYIITSSSSGAGGFSNSVASVLARMPGVVAVSTVYSDQFDFRGSLSGLTAVSPVDLPETVILDLTAGQGAPALGAGQLLIDNTTANAKHLSVGSVVRVRFPQTGASTMRVGGIFKANALLGSFVVSDRFFRSHFNNPLPVAVLVRTAGRTSAVGEALTNRLMAYPDLKIQSRAAFVKAQEAQVNQLLGLVYALLALAVIIALIGIVNTLLLSVFERTHEIGLLRAVGMKRRQVKAMIRSESVIIALFGAIVGVIIGTGLGMALVVSLRKEGITDMVVPFSSLAVFLVLSALLGLGAAGWPARRAAKLDILAAIASE
jgi:putative ABC transport system permease protein